VQRDVVLAGPSYTREPLNSRLHEKHVGNKPIEYDDNPIGVIGVGYANPALQCGEVWGFGTDVSAAAHIITRRALYTTYTFFSKAIKLSDVYRKG
jgi:GAF domain-containing protein